MEVSISGKCDCMPHVTDRYATELTAWKNKKKRRFYLCARF